MKRLIRRGFSLDGQAALAFRGFRRAVGRQSAATKGTCPQSPSFGQNASGPGIDQYDGRAVPIAWMRLGA